jgi:hypothetical protein
MDGLEAGPDAMERHPDVLERHLAVLEHDLDAVDAAHYYLVKEDAPPYGTDKPGQP